MPIRDFLCGTCHVTTERVYFGNPQTVTCSTCHTTLTLLPRSQEGEGHTTHVRIKLYPGEVSSTYYKGPSPLRRPKADLDPSQR